MRVNFDMPENVFDELTELSEDKGKSKAQVLRDAIALESWVAEIKESGGHLLIERDGKVTEVVLR